MTDLLFFNEQNKVYPGINRPYFAQLEQFALLAKNNNFQIPNLGMFGEASTGKTTSSKLLAKAAGYNFLDINAVDIKTSFGLHDMLYDMFIDASNDTFVRYKNGKSYTPVDKIIILIDEAHSLKESVQTYFLSLLERKTGPFDEARDLTFLLDNITWVFATTDSSKLLYPLTTRLHPITFDQYTRDDIKHIIAIKYKQIEDAGLTILAQCSKLVPRAALRNSEMCVSSVAKDTPITEEVVAGFVKNFLNMETNGIDSIDKRILLYLTSYKKKVAPNELIALSGFSKIKEELENKGLSNLTQEEHQLYNRAKFQTMILTEQVNAAEPIPKGRQDISLACRLLDLRDLEVRLSYLESIGFIEKTTRGIVLAKEYRQQVL